LTAVAEFNERMTL